MPTSAPRTLASVHDILLRLAPASLIDIGVGHGKTGVLLREFTDIWHKRYTRPEWKTRIYGVEVYEQYRNPLWDYAYDEVRLGDALQVLPGLPDVEAIAALDVWEHFTPDYAAALKDLCLRKADYLLICTPIVVRKQGNVFGNEWERHVSRWTPRDFTDVKHRLVACTGYDWVLLLSNRKPIPYEVWRLHRRWEHLMRGWRTFKHLLPHKNW